MLLTNNINRIFRSTLIWVIIYFLIALSFIFIANENSLDFLFKNPTFYTDIIFSLTVTFAIGFYLRALNKKLDKNYSWYGQFKVRLFKQIIWGVIIPFTLAMLLEILYLKTINISFFESAMLNFEMPLALLFLIMLNLIYITIYIYKNRQIETVFKTEQVMLSPPKCLEYIITQRGFSEEKIEIHNCAFIQSENRTLWLHTFDGEKYRLQGTLEQWEEKLKDSNFYRINRQYLSSVKAIKSVEQTETRKLKVNFILPTTDNVFISKPNIANFRQWWKQ